MSSLDAESAVLLSIVVDIDPAFPVVFLQTGMHFLETLEYRQELSAKLGLSNVINAAPAGAEIGTSNPYGSLWHFDADARCHLRKLMPLRRALKPYMSWVSGWKQHQSSTRQSLPAVERDGPHLKINPLVE